MLSKIYGSGIHGTDGFLVRCETDVENGFPQITFIGYLSAAVREAEDRVYTAIRNSGFIPEPKHVTINLSPADVRKDGCGYDLPIAVSLLKSYGIISGFFTENSLFAGELSLSGEILPVRGVISMVSAAKEAGLQYCFLPSKNVREGSVIDGIACIGADTLSDLIKILNREIPLPEPAVYQEKPEDLDYDTDFSDICGQEMLKRATCLAVGGRHNILYIGPAGTGKSMIASRIPTIMPRMTMEERLELSKLYSVCGMLTEEEPLIRRRPFRSPHHTISPQALSGGGMHPKPGEISLSTNGVLFLDELPEFKSDSLEILRQPLENKKILISRVSGSLEFPANFELVCAMNPCKCGFWPDRRKCTCNEIQVHSYISRISKPLLDRIDICVETAPIGYDELNIRGSGEKSSDIREKVEKVRAIQENRFRSYGIRFNSEMDGKLIEQFCVLSEEDNLFLKRIYESRSLSARALHKILKTARTAADFDGNENISHENLCEAIGYRSLEDKYWGGGNKIFDCAGGKMIAESRLF
jgi:magnesium chelatase family protein